MRRFSLLSLLFIIALAATGCRLWPGPPAPSTPLPTPTPPRVEDAGKRSPVVEGRLLYARGGSIWLRSGTTAQRLTEGLWATQPCWSPDGRQVVFIVRDEAYSDLWVMDADGRNGHPLTANRSEVAGFTPEFAHSSFWAFQPQWGPPEGEWIYYISHTRPEALSSNMSIWMIRPDGTEEHRLLPMNGQVESPVWSPDGQMLAFAYMPYETGPQLHYYDPNSGQVLDLGEKVEGIERYDPAWSPDGAWIAYAARQRGPTESTDIWVMPSPLNPLFFGDWSSVRLTEQGAARAPAWSPDGKQMAFIAVESDSFDLWLLNLEWAPGQPPKPAGAEKLTSGAQVDATARPSWAP